MGRTGGRCWKPWDWRFRILSSVDSTERVNYNGLTYHLAYLDDQGVIEFTDHTRRDRATTTTTTRHH